MFMPIVPVAPARLSITVVTPRLSPSACPRTRARVSLRPPAANGTTRRTGLEGYGATAPLAALAAARTRTSAQRRRGGFIGSEPVGSSGPRRPPRQWVATCRALFRERADRESGRARRPAIRGPWYG